MKSLLFIQQLLESQIDPVCNSLANNKQHQIKSYNFKDEMNQ